jgi:hypothetical protein
MASGSSTVKSVEITLLDSTPARLPSGTLFGGVTRYATYTAAALAAGALIKMIRCQKGEIVVGGRVYWEALGANTVITVGTTDSTNRFMTICPTVAASDNGQPSADHAPTGLFNVFAGIGYEFTAAGDILIACNDQTFTGALKMVAHVLHAGAA